jgi:hypothetical protein
MSDTTTTQPTNQATDVDNKTPNDPNCCTVPPVDPGPST